MALYKITVSYDGTDLHGFQKQLNHRTAQGEIEDALRQLGWAGDTITASGRTDSGVHAEGQIAAFELDWNHPDEELERAINFLLPSDISINKATRVNSDFHPRYDAVYRKYRYQVYISPIIEPLTERYHWRVWPEPDFEKIRQAANVFCGEHDFALYGKPAKRSGRTLRKVESVKWQRIKGNTAFLHIKANSFLYHMVRRIAFILVRVGQGKVMQNAIADSFEGIDNLPSGIAPARGLILEEVFY